MTINKNLFAPQKFQVIINRFPTTEFWAKSVEIPSISTGAVNIPTGASVDFYQIGDKLKYSECEIEFFLDEDLKSLEEIYQWQIDAVQKPQPQHHIYDVVTVMFLTNNQNANRKMVLHNAFPSDVSGFNVHAASSEDDPITMRVTFRFSHLSYNDMRIDI